MKKSVVRNIISTLTIVSVSFLILDYAFGRVIGIAESHAKGGDTFNRYYINNVSEDSILIMGSSRANHHYIPDSIANALNMSAYNCGIDGNGIILAYSFLNNIIRRGACPKLIIYDYFPPFDLYENDDRTKALSHLKPEFDKPGIKEIIDDIDSDEFIKLHFAAYRYNSIFIQVFSDAVNPRQSVTKGYKALSGSIQGRFARPAKDGLKNIDPVKLKYFRKFLKLAVDNNIRIIFVTSPYFHRTDSSQNYHSLLDSVVDTRSYRYFDFLNNPEFTEQKDLFTDPSHMNDAGAKKFTKALIDSIFSRVL